MNLRLISLENCKSNMLMKFQGNARIPEVYTFVV